MSGTKQEPIKFNPECSRCEDNEFHFKCLQEELEALKLDTQNDWKRIQDAERELDAVKAERDELKELVREAREHIDSCGCARDGWKEWRERARKALGV